ncbi:MAG: hypothetical protein CL843_14665 [Crocinitomicaceae bacterium]|nr:hypothetical protein [Crocinitomicaceae bacterium]
MNNNTTISKKISWKERGLRTLYFFPVQLFFAHFKYNQLMLVLWLMLFGFITQSFAVNYGIPNLFLFPEYLGKTDILAHFILGFSIGGFIMAFNIASYIINGIRFPFIATLSRPFAKYTLNNFIIPFSFIALYIYKLYFHQIYKELIDPVNVWFHILSFLGGVLLFIVLSLSYFFSTNISIDKLIKRKPTHTRPVRLAPAKNIFGKSEKWYSFVGVKREWKIYTYLSNPFKIALARNVKHYDEQMLRTVFAQNHINASLFELIVVFSIIFFGFYRETPLFALPAGASILLFFTLVLMLSSAIYSWMKGWSTLILILILFGVNQLSKNNDFAYLNYAYGIDYTEEPAPYNNQVLKAFSKDTSAFIADTQRHKEILNQWLENNKRSDGKKPKLIFVNCSGGGLRASLWSLWGLQYLDTAVDGGFMKRVHLITGSSGGMVGAAYLRDVYFQSLQDSSYYIHNPALLSDISQDILNPVALNIALHDWFFRIRTFDYAGHRYPKDRGYAFERQLSLNTHRLLDKQLQDYREPEYFADIPLLMLSPVINNDGRRMIISSQPASFMTKTKVLDNLNTISLVESVEFSRLMQNHGADSLSYLTALRMSATFPYVLPNVSLPTTPRIEVADAGIRDNYGFYNTVRYITTFKDWINENTSGVIIVQLRDRYKTVDIDEDPDPTLFESMINPVARVYGNYLQMQDYNQDEILHQTSALLNDKLSIINLQLKRTKKENISLSWHLTKEEKERIINSIYEPENQSAIEIIKLLNQ